MRQAPVLGELMYEIDSVYVSTEMILSDRFRSFPLDGLLLEACLLHFRVVWDFFYRPKKNGTDVCVSSYVPKFWTAPHQPERLKKIRKWLNAMLAHLTTHRVDPEYKAGEITEQDIQLIREHTKKLFEAFINAPITDEHRNELVNPLSRKFGQYQTLRP